MVLEVSVATHGDTALGTPEAGHGAAEETEAIIEVITGTTHDQHRSHLGHLTHLSVDNGKESYPCSPIHLLVNYNTISPIFCTFSSL